MLPDPTDPDALESLWAEPLTSVCQDCRTPLHSDEDYEGRCFGCAWLAADASEED